MKVVVTSVAGVAFASVIVAAEPTIAVATATNYWVKHCMGVDPKYFFIFSVS